MALTPERRLAGQSPRKRMFFGSDLLIVFMNGATRSLAPLLVFLCGLPSALAQDGPVTTEEKERQELIRLLQRIELPPVQGYSLSGSETAGSVRAIDRVAAAPQPPRALAPPPLKQHDIEES